MSSDPPNQNPLPVKRKAWISTPPIFEQTCAEFHKDEADWQALKANAREHYKGTKNAKTVERLITEIDAKGNNADCTHIVFHFQRLRGVAVVSLTEAKGCATLRYLLSDGSEWGTGLSLLEAAATLSQKNGNGGKLRLIPDNDDLIEYYIAKCGFIVAEKANSFSGPILTLDPTKAAQWRLENGKWYIAANEDMATWR